MVRDRLLIVIALATTIGLVGSGVVVRLAQAADQAAPLVTAIDRQALARLTTPPLGLPAVPVPSDNPVTVAKIRLGRKLFFDRRLSLNNTMSCAMCHVPEQGFTVNELAQAVGNEGRSVRRNAPTVLNAAYLRRLFHDGRETSLETQIFGPLLARNEMANPAIGFLIEKIRRLDDYAALFEQAFERGLNIETLGQTLASYQRTLLSADSAFDRWYYGKQLKALSPEAQRGFRLFMGKAQCVSCHPITDQHALFTDQAFHNTGLGWYNSMVRSKRTAPTRVQLAPGVFSDMAPEVIASVGEPSQPDLGRYEITLDPADRWRYRTPTLRNVVLTAPYMHDGSLSSLEEVVRFYNQGGHPHALLDPLIRPLHLTDEGVAALVAFLESLTGSNIAELIADARSVRIGNVTAERRRAKKADSP
jgi:cytochrome c peroxidase